MADEFPTTIGPRKLKFAPKIPVRKPPKPVPTVKREVGEEASSVVVDHELLRRVKQAELAPGRKTFRDEKKAAPIQVAFGHQSANSYARSFGASKPLHKFQESEGGPDRVFEKEYVEPWDYYSYYPTTLPMRRPYSGNPEILDEEEFGEPSDNCQYDETRTNSAMELGLMDNRGVPRMLFFQLPASLPFTSIPAPATSDIDKSKEPEKRGVLEDLPSGFMGKLLIYKSGAIKMRLGDSLFDVNAGSKCGFAQDLMAVNIREKHCSMLGELNSRAILTPDIETLVDSISDLG